MSAKVDIIVPVWNSPIETRDSLVSIVENSPDARVIIIVYGSSRETELMLEQFFEHLDENALYLVSDLNIGFVPAVNRALSRSDGDYSIIISPTVKVSSGWIDSLLKAAESESAGIITPLFHGESPPQILSPNNGATVSETASLSFSAIMLNNQMRICCGFFDETLDGGEATLFDYLRRAETFNFRSYCSAAVSLYCGKVHNYVSEKRRGELIEKSRLKIEERWGKTGCYCVYFDKETTIVDLKIFFDGIIKRARKGEQFTVLLHRKQYKEASVNALLSLHTAINVIKLPIFGSAKKALQIFEEMLKENLELKAVRGREGCFFPGVAAADLFNPELMPS